ncbi:MAG: flagellar basal body P-ring formation chaperone FlgA [Lentisphaerales bacterium]|nr:flagellar basal body P-ring formation chaperone FlgA [Lentisphaerales bacterium]
MKQALITFFIVLTSLQFNLLAEREVRIKSEVRVSGRFVLLQDLVTDDSLLDKIEKDLIIFEAPERGSKKLSIRTIAIKMQEHKELLDLSLIAPRMVRVFRVADMNFLDDVSEELLKQLSTKAPWSDYNINIEFTSEDMSSISDMSGADKIELISQTASRDVSSAKIRVKFSEKGQSLGIITINPRIQREINVVLLKNSVKKGHVLTKSDVELATIWSVGKEESLCLTIEEAIGFEVRRSMMEGNRIPLNNLTEPVYANKGQIIMVETVLGSLTVRVTGQALQLGRRGDDIRVKNTRTGKVMNAQLIASGLGRVN